MGDLAIIQTWSAHPTNRGPTKSPQTISGHKMLKAVEIESIVSIQDKTKVYTKVDGEIMGKHIDGIKKSSKPSRKDLRARRAKRLASKRKQKHKD